MADTEPDLFSPPNPRGPLRGLHVGTCSWTDPSLIKSKRFYPAGCNSAEARLRFYASQFPAVEVDSSYYAMPSAINCQRWAERTPGDFIFTVKAFRLLTGHQTAPDAFPADMQPYLPARGQAKSLYYHDVALELRDELWRRFIEAIVPLKDTGKLRAVHFQFAPWVAAGAKWSRHVEECVERMRGHEVAVEFRNQTWMTGEAAASTLAWERELGVVHVVTDEPQGVGNFVPSVWEVTHPALAIVRLHGRNAQAWNAKGLSAASDRFNYEYSDAELFDIAQQAASLDAFAVVILLNVNYEDQGTRAAQRLQRIIEDLPPDFRAPREPPAESSREGA